MARERWDFMQTWTQEPMDYARLTKKIKELEQGFPWLNIISFGKSLLGKELFALDFRPAFSHCSKKPLLMAGAFHGMEWITTTLLLAFTQSVCLSIENGRVPMDRGLVVAPCINPDGVDIQIHGAQVAGRFQNLVETSSGGDTKHWQANARGVDINHNFDAEWRALRKMEIAAGITQPGPTRFGGPYPESEPESHCLARFCRCHEFAMALALHSQGEEIYYEFGDCTPANAYALAEAFAQVSGYEVSAPSGLASYGGFKDWFIAYFRRPAFTIEVGKGVNPLPISQFPSIYEKVEPLLYTALQTD